MGAGSDCTARGSSSFHHEQSRFTRARTRIGLSGFAAEANAWCVSRYADVRAVLCDPETFSSDAMRTMLVGARPGTNPLSDPQMMQRMLGLAQALHSGACSRSRA
jgi:cytochrome P450